MVQSGNPTFGTVGKCLELNYVHNYIDFNMSCKLQGSLNLVLSVIHWFIQNDTVSAYR